MPNTETEHGQTAINSSQFLKSLCTQGKGDGDNTQFHSALNGILGLNTRSLSCCIKMEIPGYQSAKWKNSLIHSSMKLRDVNYLLTAAYINALDRHGSPDT